MSNIKSRGSDGQSRPTESLMYYTDQQTSCSGIFMF